jgi:hypothetical protein
MQNHDRNKRIRLIQVGCLISLIIGIVILVLTVINDIPLVEKLRPFISGIILIGSSLLTPIILLKTNYNICVIHLNDY